MRQPLRLPCLYPIIDSRLAGNLPPATIVELLCRGGATFLQLRAKTLSDGELMGDTRHALLAARRGGARLIVNDRPDIAALTGADGVHLGEEDLPVGDARALLGPDAIIGYSTHSVAQAMAAVSLPVDYIALGPIFATGNASVRREPLGLDALAAAAAAVTVPLVAIGGIDLARARQVLEAGAASVAVIGDLMSCPDIPARTAAYLELTRRL